MNRQRLDRIETLLYQIQNQLTKVERLLNNDNRSSDLNDLAERRRQALERQITVDAEWSFITTRFAQVQRTR